jgi:hypothetical protein
MMPVCPIWTGSAYEAQASDTREGLAAVMRRMIVSVVLVAGGTLATTQAPAAEPAGRPCPAKVLAEDCNRPPPSPPHCYPAPSGRPQGSPGCVDYDDNRGASPVETPCPSPRDDRDVLCIP